MCIGQRLRRGFPDPPRPVVSSWNSENSLRPRNILLNFPKPQNRSLACSCVASDLGLRSVPMLHGQLNEKKEEEDMSGPPQHFVEAGVGFSSFFVGEMFLQKVWGSRTRLIDCGLLLQPSRPDHQVYKSPRSLRFAPVCLLRYVVCCDCCEISLGYRLSGAPGEKRRGCSDEDCVGCSCTGHQGTSLGPFKGVSRSGRLAWGFQSAILRQGMIPSRVGANILPMVLTCS